MEVHHDRTRAVRHCLARMKAVRHHDWVVHHQSRRDDYCEMENQSTRENSIGRHRQNVEVVEFLHETKLLGPQSFRHHRPSLAGFAREFLRVRDRSDLAGVQTRGHVRKVETSRVIGHPPTNFRHVDDRLRMDLVLADC
jgi:hypothetical protein